MLQSIRKAADNLIFRTILGILVVAFGFWGVDDILRSRNNFDIVTFKNAANISEEEFARAKSREISILQRSQSINLSEEQIKQSGINEMVLDKLISSRLIDQLVSQYDIDYSDKILADFIKHQEAFKNKEGKFDINIFKAVLHHSGMNEEEYTQDAKNQLMRSSLLNSFIRASYVPDASVHNIVEFMSEERTCDIASIDLTNSGKLLPVKPFQAQLEEFYKANAELFTLPEKRSVSYLTINESAVRKETKVLESEIKQFYEENKEEFGGKPFAKVKGQIETTLKARKVDEALVDFIKKLEDEVAAGTSIKEIAANFGLKIVSLINLTQSELEADKTIGALASGIFTMHPGELSYPFELPAQKTLALIEVTSIAESQLQELDKIKVEVAKKWQLSEIKSKNTKIMQDFAATVRTESFKEEAKKFNLTLISDQKFKRAELGMNNKLPLNMLTAAFSSNIGIVNQVYINDNKAYVISVRSKEHSSEERKKILKEAGENIATQIRNSLVQEMMTHIKHQENLQINIKDKELAE